MYKSPASEAIIDHVTESCLQLLAEKLLLSWCVMGVGDVQWILLGGVRMVLRRCNRWCWEV